MRPDPKSPRRSGPCPRSRTTQKYRGHGPLLQGSKQHGFGLVAAMFLIIVIAGAIAAMRRIAATQTATSSLALQQARAYQAARAGLEWGIAKALSDKDCFPDTIFTPEGFAAEFKVEVTCGLSNVEEIIFYTLESKAEYSSVGSPDYIYRKITAVVEQP